MIADKKRVTVKILLFILPIIVFYEVIYRFSFFPIYTDSIAFDSKLVWLKKHPVKDIELIALGSSVTLYDFNSKLIADSLNKSYYNFGTWALQMSDTKIILNELVKKYHPKYVIIGSSIPDFRSPEDNSYANYFQNSELVKSYFPEFMYMINFNPLYQLAKRKSDADKVKNAIDKEYSLHMDAWGGVTLNVGKKNINWPNWNFHVNFPNTNTEIQYKALDSISHYLKLQHIKMFFIQTPIKKSYPTPAVVEKAQNMHFARCKDIVEKQGGVYLNYYNFPISTDTYFIDAYHLQGAGAVKLTKEVVYDLKKYIE